MKKYLALLLLLANPMWAASSTPGGSVAVAVDSTGTWRFLQVDSSLNLIPSSLASGFGFGSSPRIGGSVAVAQDHHQKRPHHSVRVTAGLVAVGLFAS
jgi:hypothetical protein